jgi:outer membrane protein OmpA-like peptidoglycan-associated protein
MLDPFCGESYVRGPAGPELHGQTQCQTFRDRYNAEHGTSFRVQDRLPAAPTPGFQALPPLPRLNPAGGLEIEGFPLGSAALSHDHEIAVRETAARIVVLLRDNPDSFITVDGHADDVGPAIRIEQVSQLRADAVRDALVAGGVPADRVHAYGRGNRFTLPGTQTNDPRNRRVEVTTVLRRRTFGTVLTQPLTPPSAAGGATTITPSRIPNLRLDPTYLDRPETPAETARRILRPIPPAPKSTATSPWDKIRHAADGLVDRITRGLPDSVREKARDLARSGLEAGTMVPVNQLLSNSSLPGPEQEAIRKAFEALMKTTPSETPAGSRP